MGISKMKVVISGVNLVEGGPLRVFIDIIDAFSKKNDFQIICLVNDKRLFEQYDNVEFLEYSDVKSSWVKRLYFEYWKCKEISVNLKPDIWLSMHDITPNVICDNQFVYCHNPSPFYKANLTDFIFSPKFFLFTLLYKFLYKINIKKNNSVIVQQSWISDFFLKDLNVKNTIIAKPDVIVEPFFSDVVRSSNHDELILFYPALSRTFKNFEFLLNSFAYLRVNNFDVYSKLTLNLTISPSGGKYERYLFRKYSYLENVNFLGRLTKDEVDNYYQECDVVVFPSKLETWGLPITEAKNFNKPIFLADLPYAHETLGSYNSVCFIDPDDHETFAGILNSLVNGEDVFDKAYFMEKEGICNGWGHLASRIIDLSK